MGFKRVLLALWLAFFCAQMSHAQDDVVLKFHTNVRAQSPVWQVLLAPWMARIEAQSKGRIRFERHPGMGLGGNFSDLYQQVSDGEVDVIWTTGLKGTKQKGAAQGIEPFSRAEVFELPFMMSNAEAVSRALWEYVETYAADEFKDVRLLALHVQGPGAIHTAVLPIRKLADLKGLRLQSEARFIAQLLASVGSLPQKAPRNTVGPLLSSNKLNGFIGDWNEATALAIGGLVKHHTQFGAPVGELFTRTFMLAMNPKRYESLPEDLRAIIDVNAGIETSAELGRLAQLNSQASRARVQKLSGADAILTLSGADAQAFRKASVKVDQAWVAAATAKGYDGQKLLDGAKTLIQKHTR